MRKEEEEELSGRDEEEEAVAIVAKKEEDNKKDKYKTWPICLRVFESVWSLPKFGQLGPPVLAMVQV